MSLKIVLVFAILGFVAFLCISNMTDSSSVSFRKKEHREGWRRTFRSKAEACSKACKINQGFVCGALDQTCCFSEEMCEQRKRPWGSKYGFCTHTIKVIATYERIPLLPFVTDDCSYLETNRTETVIFTL